MIDGKGRWGSSAAVPEEGPRYAILLWIFDVLGFLIPTLVK